VTCLAALNYEARQVRPAPPTAARSGPLGDASDARDAFGASSGPDEGP